MSDPFQPSITSISSDIAFAERWLVKERKKENDVCLNQPRWKA
jgi:hypothetical protein